VGKSTQPAASELSANNQYVLIPCSRETEWHVSVSAPVRVYSVPPRLEQEVGSGVGESVGLARER